MRFPLLIFCSFMGLAIFGQAKTDSFLLNLIQKNASPQLKMILANPDSFRYQIIYTQIDRDKKNLPYFHSYYLRVNPEEYFNPASTVKLPLAFLALEKINSLQQYKVGRSTTMLTDSSYTGQTAVSTDSSAFNKLPSVAQYIRKIFLVSDNDAYSRLYEFLGQGYINQRLHSLGYPDIRITRRFSPMSEEGNRYTNAIRFMQNGQLLYLQPPAYNDAAFDFSRRVELGKAHFDENDKLVNAPMDFTRHNNIPLEDLTKMLIAVLFPESVPASNRFRLHNSDYSFLYQYMSEYPKESSFPRYDSLVYFDAYCKFFLFKSGRVKIPDYIRIFNKPGWAYGFLTDVAYIADFKHNIEFMLSAVIYVNSDGVLNDDKYDYDETGYPFFREIGEIIYRFEQERKRNCTPDLKKFKLHYN